VETPPTNAFGCKGDHFLSRFVTHHGGYTCNVCNVKQLNKVQMYGCRPCDYAVCMDCFNKHSFRVQEHAMAPPPPQAKFVSDVTMTDGCVVTPGERMNKTWRVRNSGGEQWAAGTRIVHVGGDPMGGPMTGIEVPRANPGEAVNVSVPLIMPQLPGRYTSYWRMITPAPTKQKFGHRFWVTVQVILPAVLFRAPPPPVAPAVVVGYPVIPPPRVMTTTPSAPLVENEVVDPEFEQAVATITDAGFNDIDKIVKYLREENGNTSNVFDRLLGEQNV